jgi:hypothetical protein
MIATALLEAVATRVSQAPAGLPAAKLQRDLRAQFDGLRVVVCSDDDVPPRAQPAFGNAHCKLYYLDASAHCVTLTADAEVATGLVVGLRGEDAD